MHQKNFVICDKEADYARNLMQMIGSRKELGFQMHMFQKLEPLKKFAEQKSIQVLLIGEEYLAEERVQIPAAEKFVLVKEEGRTLEDEEKELYKYQSVDQILTKVLEFSLNDQSTLPKARKKTRGSMIGVYSPVHRIGKTKYALELGKEMAQKGPVLYLNLEEYSGCEHYFSAQQDQNLGDLLYYAKQEAGNIGLRISMMTNQMENLDYILPIPVVQDLQAVSKEEWMQLFEQILEKSIYEVLLLDLGDSVNGLFSILEACDSVHTLYIEEPAARAKMKQYTDNLLRTGHEKILEHTVQKSVKSKNGGTVI